MKPEILTFRKAWSRFTLLLFSKLSTKVCEAIHSMKMLVEWCAMLKNPLLLCWKAVSWYFSRLLLSKFSLFLALLSLYCRSEVRATSWVGESHPLLPPSSCCHFRLSLKDRQRGRDELHLSSSSDEEEGRGREDFAGASSLWIQEGRLSKGNTV